MKMIVFIKDNDNVSFFIRAAKFLFAADEKEIYSFVNAEELIIKELPDFVFMDVNEPVNGDDMMTTLRNSNANNRLRAAIINTEAFKFNILKVFTFKTFLNQYLPLKWLSRQF